MPSRLLFPPPTQSAGLKRFVVGFRRPVLAPWPWQPTMLTAVNCYLLWGFTWFQFLTTLPSFSYRGQNLGFYSASTEPFGATIPETFLAYSIALSVFAVSAVLGGTWSAPRIWKRACAVGIFAVIAVGSSCVNLHLRHYCYDQAVFFRDQAQEAYHRSLTTHYDSDDESAAQLLEWDRRKLEQYDDGIRLYREKYGIGETSGAQ